MKVEYYYDGQFHRVLMHLIRLFGDFQVRFGSDEDGNPKYRKVPCRYADISRMAQYIINGNSENVAKSSPMMTISVDSFTMARKDVRSHWSQKIVLGTNVSPAQNEYTNKLAEQHLVERFNPVPWDLTFSVNIWTTLLTTKMEILEQLACLFAPAVTLQTSENPLDWCSLTDVELIDTQFSSRAVPQGTDTDLDIATMTFKCQIWMSLPAKVSKPKLIEQIVTNMQIANTEQDFILSDYNDIVVDVFTPKNMGILVDKIESGDKSTEVYELTLVGQGLNTISANGRIYSWEVYFDYLDKSHKGKQKQIRFLTSLEDPTPIKSEVLSVGHDESSNKLLVQVDSSIYTSKFGIRTFIIEDNQLVNAHPEEIYINVSERNIHYKNSVIPPNYAAIITNDGATLIEPSSIEGYVYNMDDENYYRFNREFGWHRVIMNKYRAGYWRIGFKE
ncbi:hypothetical protein BZF66_06990 [Salmonella enterica]|nr:tail sheath stabiliser [Salmonella phage Munch]EAZ2023043.1 hypothetical protein [Salmonella enterica]ECV9084179.1 hypothetical protein [Salmonella enterica subsp. enterica serovar Infantis]MCP0435720.1 tail sheath stabilizer and completion protein [Salmonella enterica subsp. enterica serovar Mbandaka]EHX8550495.1 tail sheath stabilizer and completion protein [Salmonella enterica]